MPCGDRQRSGASTGECSSSRPSHCDNGLRSAAVLLGYLKLPSCKRFMRVPHRVPAIHAIVGTRSLGQSRCGQGRYGSASVCRDSSGNTRLPAQVWRELEGSRAPQSTRRDDLPSVGAGRHGAFNSTGRENVPVSVSPQGLTPTLAINCLPGRSPS